MEAGTGPIGLAYGLVNWTGLTGPPDQTAKDRTARPYTILQLLPSKAGPSLATIRTGMDAEAG